ncbi:MAG: hypothetical protein MI921_01490 [Cytophagales bacterium]|nr:hypothetical protein [Cytophagales bacterium]
MFIKLWTQREKIKPETSVKAYLFRMVTNQAFNYVRDTVKHEDLSEELWKDVLKSAGQTDDIVGGISKSHTDGYSRSCRYNYS